MTTRAKSRDVLRILIAHSHPVIRRGIEATIRAEADFTTVAAVGDGERALAQTRRLHPDIGIIEFDLPRVSGLHIVATMAREGLATKMLLLSEHCLGANVYQAMTAGAVGYLTTRAPLEDICRAIRRAAEGRRTFSDAAQTALQEYLQQQARASEPETTPAPRRPLLTDREAQVLRCIAEGISIMETGRRLHMSESTVKNHRHSMFAKLGVSNAPAAVYAGVRSGLLPSSRVKKVS